MISKNKLQNKIIKYSAKIFETNIEIIKTKGKGNTKSSDARRLASLLLRKHTRMTYKEIGELMGGRTHDLIMYYVDSAIDLIETNPGFKNDVIFVDRKVIKYKYEINYEYDNDYVSYRTRQIKRNKK